MDMITYLEKSNLDYFKEGSHWALKECPFCKHKDCFKINEKMFQCFSCKQAGNAFKLDSLLNGIPYQESKSKLLNRDVYISEDEFIVKKNNDTLFNTPDFLKWLVNERKISPSVLKQFSIGAYVNSDNSSIFCFPYFKDKLVLNTKFRTSDKSKVFQKKNSDFYIYNYNAIKDAKKILILEGEIDVLTSYTFKLNIPTISFGLGANTIKDEWKDLFVETETVYIAYDTDEVGRKGAFALANFIGKDKCRIVNLPHKDLNECLLKNIAREEIIDLIQKSLYLDQIEIFAIIDQIKPDDKVLGSKLESVLQMIAERPSIEVEDYFKYIRDRLPITYQQLHDMRKELKSIRKENYIRESKKELPKIKIPEDIKNDAMTFLKSDNILNILENYLTDVGIVGENYNKVALWLFMLSRKLDKPIHAIVFGQSSSGKSELVKKVISTMPDEDVLEFTSMTARALDYREDDLINKIISISELNGTEEIDHTLRVAQSEQRLMRAYTVKDEVTGNMKNIERSIVIKSTFIITTTETSINNENNTRIFSLFADESLEQTKRINDFIKSTHTREFKLNNLKRKRVTEVLKAVQHLIRPIEVVIPFANLLEFPSTSTRNRRDLSRFLSFITVITLLNQHKKITKSDELGEYIEADLLDYELTYNYLLPIIKNTLADLSPRDELVLKVCCLLQDSLKEKIGERVFTIKEIQSMAIKKNIDLKNSVNLRNELFELVEKDYLELVGGQYGKKGSRQKFKVIANYKFNEDGSLDIDSSKESPILSPTELEQKLKL